MNGLASFLALAAAGLTALVVFEVRPQPAARSDAADMPPRQRAASAPPVPQILDANPAPLADTVLARPLFNQTRRLANVASPVVSAPSAAIPLPRMTAILIDGPRRSAIFAGPGSKPSIVTEGGRIGPFTVQTIEPQHVIVIGPEGKRTVRTSFDPTLQPPAASSGQPLIIPPRAPSAGYGLPQPAGAAR